MNYSYLGASMCDNAIYEEVVPNEYEIQIKKNECYEDNAIKTSSDDAPKIHTPCGEKQSSKKGFVLTVVTLVLVLGALAASTMYALAEISKLKSEIETSSNQQYSTLQGLSNATEEKLAALDARITHVQTSSQGAAQQFAQNNSALKTELRSLAYFSNITHQELHRSISVINSTLGQTCDTLPASSPAGYYYFHNSTGSRVRHYCPLISARCGLIGRWRLITSLNTGICYTTLRQHTYTYSNTNRSLCVRGSDNPGCSSVILPTFTAYRSVCGYVNAYQFGETDAFNNPYSSIDSTYMDGVSITHGSPRQHIWTFTATRNENSGHTGCPCMGGRDRRPRFVKNDYFCDTGTSTGHGRVFYGSDLLWNGYGCGSTNNCCDFNNPPWFYKELSQYTDDDIELRLCSDNYRKYEDIALQRVYIYVK